MGCEEQLKSEFHIFDWFPGPQNLDIFKKSYYWDDTAV